MDRTPEDARMPSASDQDDTGTAASPAAAAPRDLPLSLPVRGESEQAALREVLAPSNHAGGGRYTRACRAALEMACLVGGLGPGEAVILPSWTFCSTANAVALRGAVFVDAEPATLKLDPAAVAQAMTPRTRAILRVHNAGVGCDMDRSAPSPTAEAWRRPRARPRPWSPAGRLRRARRLQRPRHQEPRPRRRCASAARPISPDWGPAWHRCSSSSVAPDSLTSQAEVMRQAADGTGKAGSPIAGCDGPPRTNACVEWSLLEWIERNMNPEECAPTARHAHLPRRATAARACPGRGGGAPAA